METPHPPTFKSHIQVPHPSHTLISDIPAPQAKPSSMLGIQPLQIISFFSGYRLSSMQSSPIL